MVQFLGESLDTVGWGTARRRAVCVGRPTQNRWKQIYDNPTHIVKDFFAFGRSTKIAL
jgi:hypothetical protein